MSEWKYYYHAVIPTAAPHEEVDVSEIEDGRIWKQYPKALLARWTSGWDNNCETNWWYVIKDTPFDISTLKAKRRYEINKGHKNFEVKVIDPQDLIEDIYRVTVAAYSAWPEKYRPVVTINQIKESVTYWNSSVVFGAYSQDEKILEGYAVLYDKGDYVEFAVLRVNPKVESLGINAVIVDSILTYFNDRMHDGFYICDGSRSIRHETAFQDYLEKYFEFRKSYCKLNIKYKKGFGLVIKLLFPFRRLIKGRTGIGSQIVSIMKLEEIYREND